MKRFDFYADNYHLEKDENDWGDWVSYDEASAIEQALINILFEMGPCDPDCTIEAPNPCSYNEAEKLLPEGWRDLERARRGALEE